MLGGWVALQPGRQQQSTFTQWPARRKHRKKRAAEEEQKERRAEKKNRKRQAKAEQQRHTLAGRGIGVLCKRCCVYDAAAARVGFFLH